MNTPSEKPSAEADPDAPEPRPGVEGMPPHERDERNLAMLAHLSGLLLNFIVPLVVWFMYRDRADKEMVAREAREALNFQITVLIAYVICLILTVVVVGFYLFWLIWLINLVCCVWAAIRVAETGTFRYPFALRLVS